MASRTLESSVVLRDEHNSLQRHGIHEAHRQLLLRMQRSGLSTIKVLVTRRAGKLKFSFTGSEERWNTSAVDTNLLGNAHREDSEFYAVAKDRLEALRRGVASRVKR